MQGSCHNCALVAPRGLRPIATSDTRTAPNLATHKQVWGPILAPRFSGTLKAALRKWSARTHLACAPFVPALASSGPIADATWTNAYVRCQLTQARRSLAFRRSLSEGSTMASAEGLGHYTGSLDSAPLHCAYQTTPSLVLLLVSRPRLATYVPPLERSALH